MKQALSMYTRILPDSEYKSLIGLAKINGEDAFVEPLLFQFSHQVRNPQIAQALLQGYAQKILSCGCWHCLIMREREELTVYDVWLRQLQYCNGYLEFQLN